MNKDKTLLLTTGVLSILAGCRALYLQTKSAATKVLAVKAIESNKEGSVNGTHSEQNLNPTQEPKKYRKIQDIIKSNKANKFSGAWKILPNRERFESVFFASATSVAVGCLAYTGCIDLPIMLGVGIGIALFDHGRG